MAIRTIRFVLLMLNSLCVADAKKVAVGVDPGGILDFSFVEEKRLETSNTMGNSEITVEEVDSLVVETKTEEFIAKVQKSHETAFIEALKKDGYAMKAEMWPSSCTLRSAQDLRSRLSPGTSWKKVRSFGSSLSRLATRLNPRTKCKNVWKSFKIEKCNDNNEDFGLVKYTEERCLEGIGIFWSEQHQDMQGFKEFKKLRDSGIVSQIDKDGAVQMVWSGPPEECDKDQCGRWCFPPEVPIASPPYCRSDLDAIYDDATSSDAIFSPSSLRKDADTKCEGIPDLDTITNCDTPGARDCAIATSKLQGDRKKRGDDWLEKCTESKEGRNDDDASRRKDAETKCEGIPDLDTTNCDTPGARECAIATSKLQGDRKKRGDAWLEKCTGLSSECKTGWSPVVANAISTCGKR